VGTWGLRIIDRPEVRRQSIDASAAVMFFEHAAEHNAVER
jgi:hypothetical protein